MPGPVSQSYDGPSDDPPPFPPRWAFPHLSDRAYEALKSGNDRGQPIVEDDGPCPPGQHHWVGRQMGGSPDMVESYEWVAYCDVCGAEKMGDD